MNSSFDKLVKNLSDEDFKYLVKEFVSENLELLKQKGDYPYSSSKDRKIGDDGKISDAYISVKDYLTCGETWGKFEMKNVGVYHDHYFKKGVLLLADVYEKFIDTCSKYYGLDPCHYFSSPGLSWDAMLKMTGIKLEKISDIDKYLFIEKGLRGISYIAKDILKQITIFK